MPVKYLVEPFEYSHPNRSLVLSLSSILDEIVVAITVGDAVS